MESKLFSVSNNNSKNAYYGLSNSICSSVFTEQCIPVCIYWSLSERPVCKIVSSFVAIKGILTSIEIKLFSVSKNEIVLKKKLSQHCRCCQVNMQAERNLNLEKIPEDGLQSSQNR